MSATKDHGTCKYIAMCWNLSMALNFGSKQMRPHYSHPSRKLLLGGQKKKRDSRNDVVETREKDPTTMKRTGSSIECAHCKGVGHNVRTCKKKVVISECLSIFHKFHNIQKFHNFMFDKKLDEGTNQAEGEKDLPSAPQRKPKLCGYCKEQGHDSRTCPAKVK